MPYWTTTGLSEPHLFAQELPVGLGRLRRQHEVGRIANLADDHENDQRDQQHRDDRLAESPQDVGDHDAVPALTSDSAALALSSSLRIFWLPVRGHSSTNST